MTYSLDLRKKALQYIENGGTWESASKVFQVTTRTLAIRENMAGQLEDNRLLALFQA